MIVEKNMSNLKCGFTTGSCAAAASKAATYMLLMGTEKRSISIITPKGISFDAKIVDIKRSDRQVSCAVIKDGGDDPDVTTGAHIVATVSLLPREEGIIIDGGEGVGRVTQPGLDQQPGMAAINRVPRQMILDAIKDVIRLCDYEGGIKAVISVPEGRELAEKTFNPRLGIEGGISIIGTSGIVEPMSEKAIVDTIRVELSQRIITEGKTVIIAPGNYGQDFMKQYYDYDIDRSVKCSNYIGQTIDIAGELGFEKVLLIGHIGKLVKLSGGIMNTHSKEADCRMELLMAAALTAGATPSVLSKILQCINTEQAIDLLMDYSIMQETMNVVMERALSYLNKRAQDNLQIECIMYSTKHGLLAKSNNAEKILGDVK